MVPTLSTSARVASRALTCALLFVAVTPRGAQAEPAKHKRGKTPVEGVINLNRASEAELRLLPGIGKGKAAAIVARRQGHPFASLEEVARIKGLRKLVQRLHAHLTLEGPTTLHPIARAVKGEDPTALAQTGPPAQAR